MTNNTFYDSYARKVVRSIAAPYPGIKFDIVEYPDIPGMVFLRFYADNLYSHSDSQLVSIAEWMQKLLDELNSHPLMLAKYTWECKE
jgi:hypothetical protein